MMTDADRSVWWRSPRRSEFIPQADRSHSRNIRSHCQCVRDARTDSRDVRAHSLEGPVHGRVWWRSPKRTSCEHASRYARTHVGMYADSVPSLSQVIPDAGHHSTMASSMPNDIHLDSDHCSDTLPCLSYLLPLAQLPELIPRLSELIPMLYR